MRPSPTPKYHQLSENLRRDILAGFYPMGSQLPTELSLCEKYGVSRGTVRKAYDILEQDGLIRREQGSGIFVAERAPTPNQFALIENRSLSTRTLRQEIIPADATLAEKLSIPQGTDVIHIIQLQSENGQAIIYEERHLSAALCPNLIHENLESQSIHTLLIQTYGLSLVRMSHDIEIRQIEGDAAQLLNMGTGQKAFFVDRLSYTLQDDNVIPAVWYQAVYRRDDFQFQAAFDASI